MDEVIRLRTDKETKRAVIEQSRNKGLTMSNYMRSLIKKDIKGGVHR